MRVATAISAATFALAMLLALPAIERPARSADDAAGLIDGQAPQYQAYLLSRLEVLRERYFPAPSSLLDGNSHIYAASLMAASEVRAWRWTGDARYAESALGRVRIIATKSDQIREADFFTIYPLTLAYRELAADKRIDDELRASMERFVAKTFVPRDETSLHNQTLTRACGLELAAQTWPHLEAARGWHDYALKIYAMLESMEDVPENSPNYNTFDLVCPFVLSDLLGKPELLARPGIRAMLLRYRDQVTPLGWIPPYGDSGNPSRPLDPNWPMNVPWAAYVAAFERAARQYDEPTFRWSALHMAQAGSRLQPLGRIYADVVDLFYMGFVVDWADTTIAPQEPKLASAVLTRRDARSTAALDKLILAPSRRPGAPLVLSDLHVGGMHDHENQHGAVDYFEFADQPLLTSLGYNSRGPEHTNLLLMRSEADTFPHVAKMFTPSEWHESLLPTARLPIVDRERPSLRQIDLMVFRVTARRRGVTCWVESMRLLGPGREPRVIEGFADLKTWRGRPRPVHEPGTSSTLRWELPQGVHFLQKAAGPQSFDCGEYPNLAIKWKLSNNDEQARPFILRVGHDFHLHVIQLEPTLHEAKVEQRGDDQFGLLRFSGWFTPDTQHERQMVLTSSGVLVVRDTLVPGAAARGMTAGPIWHFGPNSEPRSGPNWFGSAGGRLSLLVSFEPAPGRSCGLQTTNVWRKENQRTAFAREVVEPGRRTQFVSVLVPHSPDLRAEDLARSIEIATRDGKTSVRLRLPQPAHIEIGDDGKWSVSRD